MKILIVHNRYHIRGGEDTVFETEAEMLQQRGNVVETILFENIEGRGFANKVFFFLKSIFNFNSYNQFIKKIDTFHPDIVHIHNLFYSASPSIIYAARKRKVPVVMTIHNFRLLCPGALFLRNGHLCEICRQLEFPWSAIRNKCFKRSMVASTGLAIMLFIHNVFGTWKKVNGYIFLTDFQKSKFLSSSLKISTAQIFIKPNHVCLQKQKPITSSDNDNKNPYFLFAGRLSEEKGIEALLNSWKDIQNCLYIAGDGPLLEDVKKSGSTNDNIKYLGKLNKSDLFELMANAYAIIVPSICYENCPMVMIEAFSVGIPVIASCIGSLKTLIDHEVNGLLFVAGDHNDLKEAIKRILNDHELYLKLKAGARTSYLEKYSPERSYTRLIEIYNSVISV